MAHRVLRYSLLLTHLICIVSAQSTVNLLLVNDDTNMAGKEAVQGALNYIRQNEGSSMTIGRVFEITNNVSNVYSFSDNICNVVNEAMESDGPPHLVIDTTLMGSSSDIVKFLTRALAIPTISMSYGLHGDLKEWRTLDAEQKKYLVQVMPPGDGIVHVIRQIVSEQSMTNAAVIYDDQFMLGHHFKSLLINLPARLILKKMEMDQEKMMNGIKHAGITNVFVVGSLSSIDQILSVAQSLNMYGKEYTWFSISKELNNDVKCSQCDKTKLVYIRPSDGSFTNINNINPYNVKRMPKIDSAFYFDTAIRGIKAVGNMLNQNKWPADLQFIGCKDYDDANPPARTGLDFRGALQSTQPVAFTDLTWRGNGMTLNKFTMDMYQVNIMNKQKVSQEMLGTWTTSMPPERIVFEPGKTLESGKAATKLRVVTVLQEPFVMKEGDDYTGYCIDLMQEIQKEFSFEYEIYVVEDKKFGTMDENNEWNGMIRELIDKKADIALAPLSVMAERETVVDFTVPYYELVGISILMKNPISPNVLFKFLTVMKTEVWLAFLGAYALTGFLLWTYDRFSPYSYQNNKEKFKNDSEEEKRVFTVKECYWFCLLTLTSQGGGEAPKNLSGRLVAATWWLFGFIMIASYAANLAAFLTVGRLEEPAEKLDDLLKQTNVQYSALDGTSTMAYFKRMYDIEKRFYDIWKDMSLNESLSNWERAKQSVWEYPVSDKYTKLWLEMEKSGFPTTNEKAIERVRESESDLDGYAYIGDATKMRYYEMTDCDFKMVGEEFSKKPYALAVQKGSLLRTPLNDAIMKLLNQRKLEPLKEKWWNNNPNKKECKGTDRENYATNVNNIGGWFILISIGIIMALIALGIEYGYYSRKKSPHVSNSPKILTVQQFNGDKKPDFQTEYKDKEASMSPVGNPW